jgi:exopolyphosphatase/guanosine-5'-triphosphate,3'-diphosphate pyrophosphatase
VIKSTGDLSNLGKESDNLGNLSENSINRVTNIAERYKKIAEENNAENLYLIATEVVRQAPNKNQLVTSLADIGSLNILSPQEEALCVFIASTASFRVKLNNNRPILVIDQGGGSTELVLGRLHEGTHIVEGIALASLGTATLARMFLDYNYLSDGFSAVQKYVQTTLKGMPPLGNSAESSPKIAIAHGSAIMIFTRGIFREKYGYEPRLNELHGKMVKSALIDRRVQETIPGLKGIRKSDLGDELKPDSELVTLMSGILTYNEIAKQYNINEFVISREGLRYGALLWKSGVKYDLQTPE